MLKELEELLSSLEIDWRRVDSAVKTLGENVNAWVSVESLLASLYGVVEYGSDAYKLTEIFLQNGFDVRANDGRNVDSCLEELCHTRYIAEVLPVIELLLNSGANETKAVEPDSAFRQAIGWGLDGWGEGCTRMQICSKQLIEWYCAQVVDYQAKAFGDIRRLSGRALRRLRR